MTNEKRIEIETRIIRRYVKDVLAAGYTARVDDGGDELLTPTTNAAEIVEQITAVDEARVYLDKGGVPQSFLYFVLGNEPGEVLNDYGVSLEPVIAAANSYAEKWA